MLKFWSDLCGKNFQNLGRGFAGPEAEGEREEGSQILIGSARQKRPKFGKGPCGFGREGGKWVHFNFGWICEAQTFKTWVGALRGREAREEREEKVPKFGWDLRG